MYSEEQKAKALCIYHRIGSVTDTVRRLGYPSREHLYTWIRNEGTTKEKRKRLNLKNTTEHPRNPPAEFKFEVLRRCFENGESVKSLSEEIGYSRASIYTWRKRYLQGGVASLMNTKNIKPEKLPDMDEKISSEEIESLRKQMYELQLEVDILKETINVLKKDPGVDWKNLKNRAKVAVIDAMKEKYPLPALLRKMKLSRSSYYYQIKALATEDKYKYLRHEVARIFLESKARYGYRRIHVELKKIGIKVSEKIVRRVMKEEGLEIKIRKARKYSSYKGEISPAVPNEVQRNFHSEKPNELLLSDILGTSEDIIYKDLEREVNRGLLIKALETLSKREQTIIRLRFGIGTAGDKELTQKEVADQLGISQSYISRLEKKIMKRLKKEILRLEGA